MIKIQTDLKNPFSEKPDYPNKIEEIEILLDKEIIVKDIKYLKNFVVVLLSGKDDKKGNPAWFSRGGVMADQLREKNPVCPFKTYIREEQGQDRTYLMFGA